MISIRPVRWPEDRPALGRLETGFTTDCIYKVTATGLGFSLEEAPCTTPIRKNYGSLADEEGLDQLPFACLAEEDGAVVGFAAGNYAAWNRRARLWHLYVAPDRRGAGIGRRLIEAALAYARGAGARELWLETQNINYPAIQFYQRVGFTLCGLDTGLYDPQGPGAGEVALYFSQPIA